MRCLQMVWNCYTQDRIVLMISSAKDLGRNSIDEKAGISAPGNVSSAATCSYVNPKTDSA